jgi:hypothetical protein
MNVLKYSTAALDSSSVVVEARLAPFFINSLMEPHNWTCLLPFMNLKCQPDASTLSPSQPPPENCYLVCMSRKTGTSAFPVKTTWYVRVMYSRLSGLHERSMLLLPAIFSLVPAFDSIIARKMSNNFSFNLNGLNGFSGPANSATVPVDEVKSADGRSISCSIEGRKKKK